MPEQTTNLRPVLPYLSQHCAAGSIPLSKRDRVIVVELTDLTRRDVDTWMDYSEAIRRSWKADKPLLILIDMSEATFSLIPYIVQRGNTMMKVQEQAITTYIGWVLRPSLMGGMFRAVLEMGYAENKHHYYIAQERESVFQWLAEQCDRFYQTP